MTEKQKPPYEEIAKKNKAKYQEEMELYKQQKDEAAENLKKGEEEQMKIQKHEGLQLLKKKEKTENIIKKTKENRQKKKKQKEKALFQTGNLQDHNPVQHFQFDTSTLRNYHPSDADSKGLLPSSKIRLWSSDCLF